MASEQPLLTCKLKSTTCSEVTKVQKAIPSGEGAVPRIFYFTLPLLLASACLALWVVPFLVRSIVQQKISFMPGSEFYSLWENVTNPTLFYLHMFNVTNPDEVSRGLSPVFKKMGPYVFREKRKKIDVIHDDVEDTIRYKEHITYHFEQETSGHLTLDDKVTMINVPYVAAASIIVNGLPWPMNDIARNVLSRYKEPLFITKTVGQAMFHGWHVEFLEKLQEELDVQFLANNTFSLMMGLNDSAIGPYLVSRGSLDFSKFGYIQQFQNKPELEWWPKGTHCRKLYGTDGTIHAPFIERGAKLFGFVPEVCRSFYLKYEKDVQFEGFTAFRYLVPPELLQSSVKHKESRCYCVHIDEDPGKCLKDGSIDLGPCRDGAPIAISTAYFLDADPEYSLKSGLQPNRSIHEGFFIVEPLSGILLELSKKIQINFILNKVKGFKSLSNVPEMLFPIFWADEHSWLDQQNADKLKSYLLLEWIARIGSYYVIPLLILLASALSLIIPRSKV